MSPIVKKLLSSLLAAVAATVISFLAKSVVPLTPDLLHPMLTAALVAAAQYVDAWGSKEQALASAKKAPSIPPLPMIGLFVIAFALSGCSLFQSKVPAIEACAPTPAQLATQVADVLAAGGDYIAALEQLALKDGENAVLCAVKAFVGNPKAEASPSNAAAKERGLAYLKSKGAQ